MDPVEPNLKVTDKRHFTAEGELKTDAVADSADSAVKTPEEPAAPRDRSFPPVTFGSFIVSLATQAADLISGEEKDLQGARQIIAVIEMLQDKTEGRRTAEETRLIDAVLFDLRLAFVGSAKEVKP